MSEENRKLRLQKQREREAKNEQELFDIIKPIIDKHDIGQLLTMGCPSDEYDPETRMLARGLIREQKLSVEELSIMLTFIWHYYFEMWSTKVEYPQGKVTLGDCFTKLAKELHPLIPRYNFMGEKIEDQPN